MLDDTNVTNFEYSILAGPALLFVGAISSMPLSRLSDYTNHPKIFLFSTSCLAAFFTTCYCFATDFYTLLWPRIFFSIISSPISPLNLRIMSMNFKIQKRGIGSGSYFITIYIGLAISSLLLLISYYFGWRLTYLLLGCISLLANVISVLSITKFNNSTEKPSLKEDIHGLYRSKTLVLCVIGLAFKYISQFARSSFESLYFTRAFPDNETAYSICNTISLLLCPWSVVILGKISDDLETRYPLIKTILCAITLLIPIPCFIVMYLTNSFVVAMICIFLASTISEAYISLSYAVMINVTIPKIRALQTAWMMSVTMIAGGTTILIIGYAYQTLEDLRISMVLSTTVPLALSSIMFFLVAKYYNHDVLEFKSINHKIFLQSPSSIMSSSQDE